MSVKGKEWTKSSSSSESLDFSQEVGLVVSSIIQRKKTKTWLGRQPAEVIWLASEKAKALIPSTGL